MTVPGIASCCFIVQLLLFFVLPTIVPGTSGAEGSDKKKKGKGKKKGAPTSSRVRNVALNVFDFFKDKHRKWTVERVVEETAKATGVSGSSIWRIRNQQKKGEVITPRKPKKDARDRTPSSTKYDEFTLSAIRRIVHGFFMKNEAPSIKKVKQKIDEDESLPSMSITTLQRLFKKIGFRFRKRSRRSLLIERDDLIEWRHKYLRQIKQFRKEGRPIFYLDETWTFAGMTTPKAWVDTNIKTSRQAFLEGFGRGGLRDPTGRGERLIVLHVGNENGFLDGAGLVFRTTGKLADYHGDMNSEKFQKWFQEELMTRLPPRSVIVMDNASYHSALIDKTPTSGSLKKDMQDWLTKKGIAWEEKMTKRELYAVIKLHKDARKKYVIDTMAEEKGFSVLRLPPYHCDLNPIEMVWAQVKNYVKSRNTNFNIKETEEMTKEALKTVTAEQWSRYCSHVVKEERKMWELEGLMDTVCDSLIIQLGEEDSDTESEEDENVGEIEGEDLMSDIDFLD